MAAVEVVASCAGTYLAMAMSSVCPCAWRVSLQVPARSTDSYHEENNGPPTDGLVFMGLISLVDPPREGVLEAVNK